MKGTPPSVSGPHRDCKFLVILPVSALPVPWIDEQVSLVHLLDQHGFREFDIGRSSHMKAKHLEKMFDEGKDLTPHLNLSKARRPGHEQRRVNVDFPNWIIDSLDAQASRLGVTRQSVIKLWIAERLKEEQKKAS